MRTSGQPVNKLENRQIIFPIIRIFLSRIRILFLRLIFEGGLYSRKYSIRCCTSVIKNQFMQLIVSRELVIW